MTTSSRGDYCDAGGDDSDDSNGCQLLVQVSVSFIIKTLEENVQKSGDISVKSCGSFNHRLFGNSILILSCTLILLFQS